MSKILCVIDGMTDPQFRMEEYPNLSAMYHVANMDTCRGAPPESLGCILRLLGVREVPGHLRGYAEALGAGIPVGEQDLVLRGSWFALDAQGRCTVPIPGPVALDMAGECHYHRLESYKSLLVFPGLASEIGRIKTVPPYDCAGKCAAQLCPEGSGALQSVFHACLSKDRCLILWGQSVPAKLPPFSPKAAVICGTTVVKGIARLLGMTLMEVPEATGDTDTDLGTKTAAALEAAKAYPFVILHINGADEASHRKNAAEKKAFLRQIDGVVLPELLRSPHEVAVVSDHGTDPETGQHLGNKQPVLSNRKRSKPASAPAGAATMADRKKAWAIGQLRRRAAELGHAPTKTDFDELTRCRIKAFLGPWPRALEEAGLKERRKKR